MGFFDLFRRKRKRRARRGNPGKDSRIKLNETIQKARTDIDHLQTQTQLINEALQQHSSELSEHKRLIDDHSARLLSLEQLISCPPANPGLTRTSQAGRPDQTSNPPPETRISAPQSFQKLDVNCFSAQEKRILAEFFQNQGMVLSYVDIARSLNKSPHTVKNQIRQMRLKADLFDRTVGDGGTNRFKLKDGLRIEKYLNVAQASS
jgi:small-conductance mechanosensitive channel